MVIFGILGLFSAKYRPFAKEAFSCTFRLMTLRPCNTNLDERIKSSITARVMPKFPKFAKFIFKYFNAISAIFVILFFVSLAYSGYAAYNIAVHGTCNPEHPDQCMLTTPQGVCSETCQQDCKCDQETCNSPDYVACGGDCDCEQNLCNKSASAAA